MNEIICWKFGPVEVPWELTITIVTGGAVGAGPRLTEVDAMFAVWKKIVVVVLDPPTCEAGGIPDDAPLDPKRFWKKLMIELVIEVGAELTA